MWEDKIVTTKTPQQLIEENIEQIKALIENCKEISEKAGVSFDPIDELFSTDDLYDYAYQQGWNTSNC